MKNEVEEKVAEFYNTLGWETKDGHTDDASRWEDLRGCAKEYVSKCRLRVLRHIPDSGENMLDMASGPIQYKEYLEYSRNFRKRYCVDLSSKALDDAKKKIGDHGVFLQGSFFDIDLKENYFDCSISLHTIFHIDKERQEEAVRKLLKVTKPGKPVIIVYANMLMSDLRIVRFLKKIMRKGPAASDIYIYAYPLGWWDRFSDAADIKILPWRFFGSGHQKRLIPDNRIGRILFSILFYIEDKFPRYIARYCYFPMIILTKKNK
ncbi:MAG: class I SAM-dependent methyltransferase [Nitrospirae bacterium]|nr:class I SAM-dependent methyltransferase [Nitrospirota bacterium]